MITVKKQWVLGSIMAVLCLTTIAFVGCSKGDDPVSNGNSPITKVKDGEQFFLSHIWVSIYGDTINIYKGNDGKLHNRCYSYAKTTTSGTDWCNVHGDSVVIKPYYKYDNSSERKGWTAHIYLIDVPVVSYITEVWFTWIEYIWPRGVAPAVVASWDAGSWKQIK